MSDLTCPYTLDWLEDPVTLPCCGRTVSRTPLLVSLNITQQCSLCRGDLSNYNALTAPMSRNIAYLVEEAKRVSGELPPPGPETPNHCDHSWKATLTLLAGENSIFQKRVGQLEFNNNNVVFKNLVLTVIDRSGSMGGSPISQVRYSLTRVTDLAYKHSNLMTTVIAYDDRIESHEINTTTPRSYFDGIFSRIDARGGTSFRVAFDEIVRIATQHANTQDVACMTILFLTDGEDSSVRKDERFRLVQSLQNDIRAVWKKEFVIHSIGFGSNHDSSFLNSLRMIGTREGAYRYADPSENADILSSKINSILDVIAESASLPLQIISSNLHIISGANGKFWIKQESEDVDPITFSIDGRDPVIVTPDIVESSELWPAWYSKLIDDIAAELLALAEVSSSTSVSLPITNTTLEHEDAILERELHLELLSRRSNAILARLEGTSANYHRLTSLMVTLESLRKGQSVDKLKLNDMKFEGQFATKTSAITSGSSAHVSTPTLIVPSKKIVWTIITLPDEKRFRPNSSSDRLIKLLGNTKTDDIITWIDDNHNHVINDHYKGSNCLHITASIGRDRVANKIISTKLLNINATDFQGRTALDLSVIHGYWRLFDLIFENGGNLRLDPQLLLRTCISRNFTELAGRLIKHSLAVVTDDMLDNVPTADGLQWLSAHSAKDLPIEMAILKGAIDIVTAKLPGSNNVSWDGLYDVFIKSTHDYINIVDLVLQSGKAMANETSIVGGDITFPLFVACEKGCLSMVKVLLKYLTKDDINQRNNKGTTALWIAACNRHIDVVHELILAGADVNIANEKGDSALIPCCQKGSDSIALLLLEAGIDINIHNRNRDNAVLICCRTGQSKILEMLLTRYSSNKDDLITVLDEYAEIDGFPPLLAATELNRIDCIKVCAKFGTNLEWKTREDNPIIPGATALHLACHYGRLDAARTLCELGCDIGSFTSVGGYTPVHIAIRSGHIALVRFLLSRNREVLNISDSDGRLPIYYASMQGREDIKEEFFTDRLSDLLGKVVTFGSSRCADILSNYGQSIGCYDHRDFLGLKIHQGMTPLSLALINGNIPLANTLESLGSPLNIPDDYGITPIFWKSFLLHENVSDHYDVSDQLRRVETISRRSLQNKMLTNLTGQSQLTGSHFKQLDFRKKMTDGYTTKVHKSSLAKIRNASEPAILGFLDKLKSNKVFPDGKGCLEQILWESRVHIVRLIASGETTLDPMHMLALYLYTANATVFTQVNATLSSYTDRSVWSSFIVCLFQAVNNLPSLIGEVYRGVECTFIPDLYTLGTIITWNTFGVASKDWRSPSELIKEKHGIIFIIKSKTGKDISRYSCSPVDSEVLFLPGTSFIVTALYRADIITLGQANIRASTYAARDIDIHKAAEGASSIIVEIAEC